MAAGLGYLDAQGVWRYGELDAEGLFSDFLNLGQESLSDQLAVDRAQMAGIEDDIDDIEADLAAATADTGWQTPTLTNSWTGATAGAIPKFRRRRGLVSFTGRVSGGTTGAAFTLPAGYRPGQDIYVPVSNGTSVGAYTTVSITTAGLVVVQASTVPYLAGIPPFVAET